MSKDVVYIVLELEILNMYDEVWNIKEVFKNKVDAERYVKIKERLDWRKKSDLKVEEFKVKSQGTK